MVRRDVPLRLIPELNVEKFQITYYLKEAILFFFINLWYSILFRKSHGVVSYTAYMP